MAGIKLWNRVRICPLQPHTETPFLVFQYGLFSLERKAVAP